MVEFIRFKRQIDNPPGLESGGEDLSVNGFGNGLPFGNSLRASGLEDNFELGNRLANNLAFNNGLQTSFRLNNRMTLPNSSPYNLPLPNNYILPQYRLLPNANGMSISNGLPNFNNMPKGLPSLNHVPNGLPSLDNLPNGLPGFNYMPNALPFFNNLPNGLPGFNNVPNALPGINNVPTGLPSLNNLPNGLPNSNNLPYGLPSLNNVPNRVPSFNNLPNGWPSLDNLPKELPGFNNMPNALPGLSNLPNGLTSFSNEPNASPGNINVPNGLRSLDNLPNGLPCFNNVPNALSGFNNLPNGMPGSNNGPSGVSNNNNNLPFPNNFLNLNNVPVGQNILNLNNVATANSLLNINNTPSSNGLPSLNNCPCNVCSQMPQNLQSDNLAPHVNIELPYINNIRTDGITIGDGKAEINRFPRNGLPDGNIISNAYNLQNRNELAQDTADLSNINDSQTNNGFAVLMNTPPSSTLANNALVDNGISSNFLKEIGLRNFAAEAHNNNMQLLTGTPDIGNVQNYNIMPVNVQRFVNDVHFNNDFADSNYCPADTGLPNEKNRLVNAVNGGMPYSHGLAVNMPDTCVQNTNDNGFLNNDFQCSNTGQLPVDNWHNDFVRTAMPPNQNVYSNGAQMFSYVPSDTESVLLSNNLNLVQELSKNFKIEGNVPFLNGLPIAGITETVTILNGPCSK